MASPGLKRGIIQHFIASFEDFLCTCRWEEIVGERSCVVPAAFNLLHRRLYLPRLPLHFILHCRVTLRVYWREEFRRKEECIVWRHHFQLMLVTWHDLITWYAFNNGGIVFSTEIFWEEDDHLLFFTHFNWQEEIQQTHILAWRS